MEEGMIQLKYDLQFFAKDGPGGEKTEEPTSKKLDDARKEGQVAKSKEIGNAFSLLEALFGHYGNPFYRSFFGSLPADTGCVKNVQRWSPGCLPACIDPGDDVSDSDYHGASPFDRGSDCDHL